MKKQSIIFIVAVSAIALAGCQQSNDELEVENPDLDLEVMIREESDD